MITKIDENLFSMKQYPTEKLLFQEHLPICKFTINQDLSSIVLFNLLRILT